MEKAKEAAEAANEAKSTFLASVSHELRTPLTSVLGFAKVIRRQLEERILPNVDADDERTQRAISQVRDNVDVIVQEGERLTTLVNNVLDLAKIEAGRFEWNMQPLSMAEVADRAMSATASLFESTDLELRRDIPDDLPQIVADRDGLMQVIINLLSNAVKFTEEGSVTCRASVTDEGVVVSVTDTGIGIAPANQPRVFDKFTQVGDTLTDKPHGTGLGLPICREIVESHGGRIWVESEPGVGSTFSFVLPVAHAEVAA
jgi:signal transduction histidine kinase